MKATMIKRTAILAFVLMGVLALPALSAGAGQSAVPLRNTATDAAARGAKAWSENCNRCHNYRNPKETSDKNWHVIANHMRVLAKFPGQTVSDILAFLQASDNSGFGGMGTPAPGSTTVPSQGLSGEEIYNQTCVACHGGNGTGLLPGVPNFTRENGPLARSDDELLLHIANGYQSPGSPMAMPPKGGNAALKNSDLRAVLSYIRESFGKPQH